MFKVKARAGLGSVRKAYESVDSHVRNRLRQWWPINIRFGSPITSSISSPQIALATFPGAVPELSINPGDSGDEAVGLDGAKNCPCLGIDLMNLTVAILANPERPFGPRESRMTAAGRRDGGEHTAGLRIDLLDPVLRDLKQVLAVKGRSCMRGDINRGATSSRSPELISANQTC